MAVDPLSGHQSACVCLEWFGAIGRRNLAAGWSATVFLRRHGPADYQPGRIRCRHPLPVGRRWPTDPDDTSYRRHPRVQLQRLRPSHCRTG
nr:hypothetical protein [Pseudomonas fluorescens]